MSEERARVGAVVLAAGASRRLGRSKARVLVPSVLPSGAEALIHRATRAATTALCVCAAPAGSADRGRVVVVIRPDDGDLAESIRERGATAIVNEEADVGMATSIRKGIAHLSTCDVDVALLLTVDQPLVTPHELATLVATVAAGQAPVSAAAASYAGKLGVPAAFASSWFPALLALEGDRGARALLAAADEGVVCSLPMPHAARDLDTEAALDELLADPEARAALTAW